jgi:F-type H+-transporting ATPase subunit b
MEHENFLEDPRSWVAIAFVIFVVLFGRRLWTAFVGMLDKRTEMVKQQLAEAGRLRTEAEAMLAEARSQREIAAAEAQRMLANARTEAENLARTTAADAEASARRRERMAMDRIAAAEKAAVDGVRFAAAEVASIAAERVLREGLTADADSHLIDTAIASLPAALAPRRVA